MAAKRFLSDDFLSIIDLEISIIERYNENAKLSLIYFRLPDRQEYDEIFERILRQTDAFIQEEEHFIAILYHTDTSGAAELLAGVQNFLDEKPLDMIVTYPKDGHNAKDLLSKLNEDIHEYYGLSLKCLQSIETPPIHETYIV